MTGLNKLGLGCNYKQFSQDSVAFFPASFILCWSPILKFTCIDWRTQKEMMNPLGIGVSITSRYIASKAVSNEVKSIDAQRFSPFLDWFDVILYGFLRSKVFGEISTRRVAKSVNVQRMNLKMRHQVFEHFIKRHGRSSKSMEEHQMRKVGRTFGINLMDVFII